MKGTLLKKLFQGQFLEFVIDMTTSEEVEEGIRVAPLVINRFLVEADETFIYLGSANPLQADTIIKIDDLRIAQITDPASHEDVMADPEKDENLN